MQTSDIQNLFDAGITKMVATMKDGSTMNLRLFMSINGHGLCYLKKGFTRRGYPVFRIADEIVSVKYSTKTPVVKTTIQKEFDMLRKFQKAFTKMAHPNLWSDIRAGYNALNISALELEVAEMSPAPQTSYDFYKILSGKRLGLVTENKYKTTTITSNKPLRGDYQYYDCINNIARHLENKETFSYGWEGKYDVSVSGKLCDDGVYRAWLSLEYRGMGNGHYYLLINENTAVFSEDD